MFRFTKKIFPFVPLAVKRNLVGARRFSSSGKNPVETTPGGVVVLDYSSLLDSSTDYSSAIETAYGENGLGLLVVKGIPGFSEARNGLLPLGFQFSELPDRVKEKVVHKESNYSIGWSHGKEILKPGVFDEYKGSYYANPQYDTPTTDPELIRKYPESCLPNIWPKEDFPALEPAFKRLGRLIVHVGELVAKQIDKYGVQYVSGYSSSDLVYNVIKNSHTCKARLLYYYPINNDTTQRTRDSWCGWHNDHGSLTGLAPAMYINTRERKYDIPVPDKDAGLYARTRQGKEVQVRIPPGHLAFQIGESTQILTAGKLKATPHAVQALRYPQSMHVGRSTFAVFMQPDNGYELKVPGNDVSKISIDRFKLGMTFGDFHKATIGAYY